MIQDLLLDKYHLRFDLEPERFPSDNNLLWYFQNNQAPEPEVIHTLLHALKPGDCAVDAGANIGVFTVLMSKLVGERGHVLAVEPDSRNVEKLRKNLDINSCQNVTICECALGDTTALVGIHHHADNGQSNVFGDGEPQDVVGLEKLDTLLGGCRPKLLKMDIEGSEVTALKGCSYQFPCIISEINTKALARAGTNARDLFTLLRERGYNRYQLHSDGSMPSRIESYQDLTITRENVNMLFAPRDYVAKHLWPEVRI